jgi:hypothetical protein
MKCHVCQGTVQGTCASCHRLFCETHWGGPEAPRCEECHRSLRWSLFVTGGGFFAIGVGLSFYVPGPPIGVPLLLLAGVILWKASLPFRSSHTREVAARPELMTDPPEPEDLASAEPETCLRCDAVIPPGTAQCPACGWSYAPQNGRR